MKKYVRRHRPDHTLDAATRRFWSHVEFTDPRGCWIWTACLTSAGYGKLGFMGNVVTAHRVAYALAHGLVILAENQRELEGFAINGDLDHICRNRRCVNPTHLRPCTRRENTLWGTAPPAVNAAKSAAPCGHAYDSSEKNGRSRVRRCKKCRAAYMASYGRRRRAAARSQK